MDARKFIRRSEYASLFGSTNNSDCVIVFLKETNAPALAQTSDSDARTRERSDPAARRALGLPLPGHQLLLREASELFAAQLDRWHEHSAAVHPSLEPSDEATTRLAAAAVASGEQLPELRIQLASADELPYALAAIKYVYTGEVRARSVSEAFAVRRQGGFLLIEGCSNACDEAIGKLLHGVTPELDSDEVVDCCAYSSVGESFLDDQKEEEDHEYLDALRPGLRELYECETVWPDPAEEPSFAAVLRMAGILLVAHFGNALNVLNTPWILEQMLSLPASGLEALLASDDFGTDSESTILLLLATWMRDNYERTDAEVRRRLCRTVRLTQLSRPYMHFILPALAADHEAAPDQPAGWFPIGVMEAAFVALTASAGRHERQHLLSANRLGPDDSPGNRPGSAISFCDRKRRQCLPMSGMCFPWSISQKRLARAHLSEPVGASGRSTTHSFYANFGDGMSEVAAHGFHWSVSIDYTVGKPAAGLLLWCHLPPVFVRVEGSRLAQPKELHVAVPVDMEVCVRRVRKGKARDLVLSLSSARSPVTLGRARNWGAALPLHQLDSVAETQQQQQPQTQRKRTRRQHQAAPRPRQQQQPSGDEGEDGDIAGGGSRDSDGPLAGWASYLRYGKIQGSITLMRSKVDEWVEVLNAMAQM